MSVAVAGLGSKDRNPHSASLIPHGLALHMSHFTHALILHSLFTVKWLHTGQDSGESGSCSLFVLFAPKRYCDRFWWDTVPLWVDTALQLGFIFLYLRAGRKRVKTKTCQQIESHGDPQRAQKQDKIYLLLCGDSFSPSSEALLRLFKSKIQ